jgi:hypothetical protein
MRRALPAAVLLFALAGCGDDPSDASGDGGTGPAGGTMPAFASQPPRPKCADVFVPGKVIRYSVEQASVGCLDPDGGVQIVGSQRCADGGRLYTVDASTGAARGWGRDGEPYHAVGGEVASDPGFGKAYDACNK